MLLDHIQLCIYDNNAFITAEFVKVSEKKQSQKCFKAGSDTGHRMYFAIESYHVYTNLVYLSNSFLCLV